MTTQTAVFCSVIPCSFVDGYQGFGGTYQEEREYCATIRNVSSNQQDRGTAQKNKPM